MMRQTAEFPIIFAMTRMESTVATATSGDCDILMSSASPSKNKTNAKITLLKIENFIKIYT